MFGKKKLTPVEQLEKSKRNIKKAQKKRDKLKNQYNSGRISKSEYDEKDKQLRRIFATEIENKNDARLQIQHPATSKTQSKTSINTTVNFNKTDNSKSVHVHGHYHRSNKD